MLKDQFIGRNPSHFQVNPVVKAFIISETLLWSAYNFIVPIFAIFVFYGMAGVGLGIGSPAKHALFSTHLDKDKEPTEWGVYDATHFFSMALAGVVGGFIASQYGFQILFFLASAVNLLGTIPYLLYIRS